MWRQYEKDIKALPAAARLQENPAASSLPAIANIAYHDNTNMRDLTSRVKLSEQSNRVLLEELMKLQQELKVALRQNEQLVLKEQQERLAMKDKVEAAENMFSKVSMQLLRTEEKVNIEHNTLTSLLNQSKEVERALAGEEQRSLLKGEQINRYLSQFRDEISQLRQSTEQINSNMRLVGEDVKTLKHRFEMQNSEFASATQEMKQRIKRVESDSMAAMDSILRKQENRDSLEASTSHLKQNVDLKISDVRDAVNETRRKSDIEASERRAADQQAQLNVEKIQVSLRELETKYQEVMHTSNLNMREKETSFEAEKNKLAYKMAELSEEQNKKALQREMQLREDAQMKFTILEKKLQDEQASRLAFEKSVRYEMENILESLKIHLSEELQNMKQNAKLTQVHGDQSLVKINECVILLEGEIDAGKKAFEEVLHAEIVARQTQNEKTVDYCEELQEKLSIAVATLQQAIAGVTTQTQDAVEKVKKDIFLVLDQSGDSGISGLADIDSRLTNLNKHILELEETLESRWNDNSGSVDVSGDYERLNKKVERTNKWQEVAEKTLKELSMKIQPLNGEITNIKDAIEDIQTEMETQRIDNLGNLDMEENSTNPIPDSNVEKKVRKMQDELVQMSSQLGKLDHTVNTLRTVLSQKIASEAKTIEFSREVFSADIKKLVNYILNEQRRVFVKYREIDAKVYRPDIEKDGTKGAHSIHLALLSINRWGLYGAYKMIKLKAAWFKVAERKKNKTPNASDDYISYEKEENGENEGENKSEKEESDKESDKESEEENEESEKESEDESEEEKSEDESEEEKSEDESEEEKSEETEKEESDEKSSEKESDNEKPVKKTQTKPSTNNGKTVSSPSDKGTDKRKNSKGK